MELRFDFASDDTKAGFRLAYFELYNWGTYNKSIVKLKLDSNNALLTGDIGSGKSTIVDAMTTLLVPHQKIIYNKAAGANTKERSLYSYIVGEYKASQDENFGNSKAIALRDHKNFTVILGRFENEGFDETLSLAQFFYINPNSSTPEKFFVISKSELSIKNDFFGFDDIRALKKRLRNTNHVSVYDTFKDYSKDFTRAMGIKNEQALNLFYQTVSLKSIGNLTEFIRVHMLESNDVEKQIDQLCSNFSDLNHTHELVLKAKHQIELLEPISKESKRYKNFVEQIELILKQQEGLNYYFASFKKELLQSKILEIEIDLKKMQSAKKHLNEELESLSENISNLKTELKNNGGDRLNQIQNEIRHSSVMLEKAKEENKLYNDLIKSLGFNAISNEHSFLKTFESLKDDFENIDEKITKIENSIMFDHNSLSKYKEKKDELDIEIIYLENHPSNIPAKVSKIRDDMASSLGLARDELPFVGELISVNDEKWYGSIERVLHNFALSLIVDSYLYEKISEYVDNTHLRGKLVYLKVNQRDKNQRLLNTTPNSMLEKLELKVDSPFFDWLNGQLHERFNIPCVEDMMEFRRFKKALSINGQFKTNLSRHEKDDRFDIDDRSRWVLGWDNLDKLQNYKKEQELLKNKIDHIKEKIKGSHKEKKDIASQRDSLRDALKYESFEKIDWYKYSKIIEKLNEEKNDLEKSNDIIQSLLESIKENQTLEKEKKDTLEQKLKNIGRLEQLKEDRNDELGATILILDNGSLEDDIKQKLDTIKNSIHSEKLNLNTLNPTQKKTKEHLDREYRSISDKKNRSSEKLIQLMGNYIRHYQIDSKEFDASIESIDEFNLKLQKLKKDNLPKWEKKFKTLLKEKTIHGIVLLQNELEKSSSQILQKIETINLNLKDIEYSEGTFIELNAQRSKNSEIKEFQQALKSLVSGSIDSENNYDEQKFLQIKGMIGRFNGREGHMDLDKKWKKTVTDVRNWYEFSASEKYISDGSQKEYYAHSGGKSGGQKEKLAYTVLASSLAYQFGLEYEKIQSRSFRFVMIDEAFGRGSDESTKYALRLFEKLKLQLLVITPKQKINVIEPHVSSVHFVHNNDGMDSSLISMKIQEYQKRKK